MSTRQTLELAIAVAATFGCAAVDVPGSDKTFTFALQAARRNAGETGQAAMTSLEDKTALVLTISGVPPWVGRPVRLYTFVYRGSCAHHDEKPAFSLNESTQPYTPGRPAVAGPFTLSKTVPLPMAALRSGGYAVVVRASPVDGGDDLFCGDIR